MNILVLSDVESKSLWDYFEKEKLEGIDLILSCGDLNPNYLSFLTCFTKAPILYIHGNHDAKYEKTPPEGCLCVDDDIYTYRGVRILGLGGCMRYKPGPFQYTQKEMNRRNRKLRFKLFFHIGFDILLTHAPDQGVNDAEDLCHQGFAGFLKLMDKYRPKFFCHGHVHMSYDRKHTRLARYKDTLVINGYEKYTFDYDNPPQIPQADFQPKVS